MSPGTRVQTIRPIRPAGSFMLPPRSAGTIESPFHLPLADDEAAVRFDATPGRISPVQKRHLEILISAPRCKNMEEDYDG